MEVTKDDPLSIISDTMDNSVAGMTFYSFVSGIPVLERRLYRFNTAPPNTCATYLSVS